MIVLACSLIGDPPAEKSRAYATPKLACPSYSTFPLTQFRPRRESYHGTDSQCRLAIPKNPFTANFTIKTKHLTTVPERTRSILKLRTMPLLRDLESARANGARSHGERPAAFPSDPRGARLRNEPIFKVQPEQNETFVPVRNEPNRHSQHPPGNEKLRIAKRTQSQKRTLARIAGRSEERR